MKEVDKSNKNARKNIFFFFRLVYLYSQLYYYKGFIVFLL